MKSFNYCCCIIAAIGLIFLGFAVIHSSNNTAKVELKPKVLCEAKSISVRTSQISTASVLLPPNSAITKIYVSMTQREGNPIDSGFISTISAGPTVFQHRFYKDPNLKVGSYETSFIQPLCVGPFPTTVNVLAEIGFLGANASTIELTVVYCPDYCEQ